MKSKLKDFVLIMLIVKTKRLKNNIFIAIYRKNADVY